MSFRVLICAASAPERGPLFPASNTMSERDAQRFAREWLARFPEHPVRVVAFAYVGA